MRLLLRDYFAVSKRLQLLQLLMAVVQFCVHSAETKNIHCYEIPLKCVKSTFNETAGTGIWYPPVLFEPLCATKDKTCRKFENQCEHVKAQCKEENWEVTRWELCEKLDVGSTGPCNCPLTENCSTAPNSICARQKATCQNFKNECELKLAQCIEGDWIKTNPIFCCEFKENERKTCLMERIVPTCATKDNKTCRRFSSFCELMKANNQSGNKWKERNMPHCKCIRPNSSGPCDCHN